MLNRDQARQLRDRLRAQAQEAGRKEDRRRAGGFVGLFRRHPTVPFAPPAASVFYPAIGRHLTSVGVVGQPVTADDDPGASFLVANLGNGVLPTDQTLIYFQFDGFLVTQYG